MEGSKRIHQRGQNYDWIEMMPFQNEQAVPEKRLERAQKLFATIRPLLQLNSLSQALRNEICEDLSISPATLYRYIEKLRARPVASTLLPSAHRNKSEPVLTTVQESLINEAISQFYLTRQKRTIVSAYRELIGLCVAEGVTAPSYSTFRRRIGELSKQSKLRSRLGPKTYNSRFSPKTEYFTANSPGEVVQIDHTLVDLILVDSVSGEEIGRPWITVLLDVHTRLIASFHLSLNAPSSQSVAEALTKAVYGNDQFLNELSLTCSWPRIGLPQKLHMDNAAEFKSNAMKRGAGEHGIELVYRPPGRPHFGGHVESVIKTLMTKVHELPGTTFSNPIERGQYNSQDKAVFTLWDLNKFLAHYICESYHKTIHSGLRSTPLIAFEQCVAIGFSPIAHVKSPDEFRADFMVKHKRKLRRSGVHYQTIAYQSPLVEEWWVQGVDEVHLIPRTNDISKIDVFGPDRQIHTLDAKDARTPQISWGEFKQLRQLVITRSKSAALSHAQIAERVQIEHTLLSEAKARKRGRRRANEARRLQNSSSAVSRPTRISTIAKDGRVTIAKEGLFKARILGSAKDD